MVHLTVTKGDKGYLITGTITTSAGVAKQLAGYTITLKAWKPNIPTAFIINALCSITDPVLGTFSYTIAVADFANAYYLNGRLELTKTNVIESIEEILITIPDAFYYCALSELKSELGIKSDENDYELTAMSAQVQDFIDRYCDRTFPLQTALTRYYDGANDLLFIDELTSISAGGLQLDEDGDGTYESTMATTDYILYPLNKSPKTYIKLSNNSDYSGFAPGILNGVKITGIWGYTTIPESIHRAAIIQVCRWFKRKDSAYTTAMGEPGMGVMSMWPRMDPDVEQLLLPYRRLRIG
jgi:hypothetical protein